MPHFEKMPYDNAQLLALYADLYAITRQPLAREMGTDLAGYMSRRMIVPEGGFYTAEDADVIGKEGETYLWTRAEITSVFGPADADRFMAFYELTPLPTEPTGAGRPAHTKRSTVIRQESRESRAGARRAGTAPIKAPRSAQSPAAAAPGALRSGFFRPSDTRTICPWKGVAHYYAVVVDGKTNADAAWYYPDPKPAARNIAGRIAFWKDIRVEE